MTHEDQFKQLERKIHDLMDRTECGGMTVHPPYKNYQASTSREIPLVMLSADVPIDIFRE